MYHLIINALHPRDLKVDRKRGRLSPQPRDKSFFRICGSRGSCRYDGNRRTRVVEKSWGRRAGECWKENFDLYIVIEDSL